VGRVLLHKAVLLDPEARDPRPGALLVESGRIETVLGPDESGPEDVERVDLEGAFLAPGFVDLHFHGSLIFADAAGFEAALRESCASLPRFGTTAFLVTTVAWPAAELAPKVVRLAALLTAAPAGGAVPIGLHLEGPWINPKSAGAQPAAGIRAFDAEEGEDVLARGAGTIRMVTFAPEVGGVEELQELLALRGIVGALGHSLARAAQVEAAAERGANHVTHLFNAMGPLHHREPGLAGAALADDRLSCDLICDGAHVDPRVTRLAWRAKGDRLALITDRVDPPPAPEGASFGSGPIRDDGIALRLPDGRLAGSRLTLDRAIHNAQLFAGMTQLEAVAACTLRPARLLGIEGDRGTLRPGARADLVVLDAGGAVRETWLGGRRAYRSEPPRRRPPIR
jgi:N-acetylglucosamine-6-phosphate deacetylase